MSDLDTLLARLTAAGTQRAYKIGAVPPSPAYPYAVLSLDTGTPSTYSLDGSSDTFRLLAVQLFGRTHDSVTDLAEKADAAFRDVPLTELPDAPLSNRVLSTAIVRDPDTAGVLYALHTYRFGES